jgi:polyisoprenoid-binding protein YceI
MKAIFVSLAAAHLYGAGVRFDVVQEQSSIAVRTDKTGIFSGFGGHKHGIVAGKFSAAICADPRTLEGASVSIRVPVAVLEIDSARARRAAGLTDSGPGAKDVAAIQEKMLSPANLAAAEHPEIGFASTSAEKKANTVVVSGPLTIRGRANTVSVPLQVTQNGNAYRFNGQLQVKLTDYGIKPESVGGVVKVADRITILLDMLARPTQEACN